MLLDNNGVFVWRISVRIKAVVVGKLSKRNWISDFRVFPVLNGCVTYTNSLQNTAVCSLSERTDRDFRLLRHDPVRRQQANIRLRSKS